MRFTLASLRRTTKRGSAKRDHQGAVLGAGYDCKTPGVGSFPVLQKLFLLAALYTSQGVSAGFVVIAFPTLLKLRGESVEVVGWAGLLSWPWSLKFLWGPIVDRFNSPGFGVRRTWILPLQLVVAVLLFLLASAGRNDVLAPLLALIVLMNLATSILDVATDAYAIDMLLPSERGWGNSIQIGGFYAGSMIGGGVFLVINEWIGTQPAFYLLGLAVFFPVCFLTTNRETHQSSFEAHRQARFSKFFQQPLAKYVLLLIVLLDFGENFGVSMLSPFLVDARLSSGDIGWLLGTGGMLAGLCGAGVAGLLLYKGSPHRSLLLFSMLQTCAMLGYVILARTDAVSLTLAGGVISVQYLLANMFNVALYTCFMEWTSPEQAATDFSIMACTHNATFLVAAPIAGYSVATFGYAWHFALACLLSLSGIGIAARIMANRRSLLMNHVVTNATCLSSHASDALGPGL